MTRRDFELIASVIAETGSEYGNYPPLDAFTRKMAAALRSTNPRFDASRFERAAMDAWMDRGVK